MFANTRKLRIRRSLYTLFVAGLVGVGPVPATAHISLDDELRVPSARDNTVFVERDDQPMHSAFRHQGRAAVVEIERPDGQARHYDALDRLRHLP